MTDDRNPLLDLPTEEDLDRTGKDWGHDELDIFLDMYLAGRGLKAIAERISRTYDNNAFNTIIWKLACNYFDYEPGERHDRATLPPGVRELQMVRTAREYVEKHGRGPTGRTLGPETIAPVLCRPLAEVRMLWDPPGREENAGFGLA